MTLSTPLSSVPGIGSSYAEKLKYLGLNTINDLIHYYPFRYEDFSNVTTIENVKLDEPVTLIGDIWSITSIHTKTHKVMTRAIFNDGTSSIELIWFNQPWLSKSINAGNKIQIAGKISKSGNKLTCLSPKWEKVLDESPANNSLHSGRIVPIYSESLGITSKWLRQKIGDSIKQVSPLIVDPIPESVRPGLLPLPEALELIHFPNTPEDIEKAKQRLSFDELFFIQIAVLKKRAEWQQKKTTYSLKINQKKIDQFIKDLPFQLTDAQKKVTSEISSDLSKPFPMNRLVQGEVGSGKTVVATIAIYISYLNNLRSILMAPTEILAFQHYNTAQKLLEPLGVKVGLYTGSKKFTKTDKDFRPDLLIGTHALLSTKLATDQVGLVIIDEQQRFGVEQRSFLRSRPDTPHFLSMTATPIPRTVALTLYGDLDLSIINELPKGRIKNKTFYVPNHKRLDAYEFIAKKMGEGDQVYLVTPLIEESETLTTVRAATVEFEKLKTTIFPKFRLGLLHGRLKPKDKTDIIDQFKAGRIDCLVSTSVVEVGVDVPNATIMVIEGAERFGLAQLHQLRGRVGRGSKESFCFLFSELVEPSLVSRLKKLETTYDGLALAELDLKIRGSGDLFGIRQSGRWELKIASFTDLELIEKTRAAAQRILHENPKLDKYPSIAAELSHLVSQVMPD